MRTPSLKLLNCLCTELVLLNRRTQIASMLTADALALPCCFLIAMTLRAGDASLAVLYGGLSYGLISVIVASCARGNAVPVSGAGGSIGSALCRQIVTLAPTRLHLVDHGGCALNTIEQALVNRFRGMIQAIVKAIVTEYIPQRPAAPVPTPLLHMQAKKPLLEINVPYCI